MEQAPISRLRPFYLYLHICILTCPHLADGAKPNQLAPRTLFSFFSQPLYITKHSACSLCVRKLYLLASSHTFSKSHHHRKIFFNNEIKIITLNETAQDLSITYFCFDTHTQPNISHPSFSPQVGLNSPKR